MNVQQEISIYGFWIAFKKRKLKFLGIFIFVFALGLLYRYNMPDVYRAEATILPIENNPGMGFAGGGAAALLSMAGVGGGQTNTNSKKMQLYLKSRVFAEKLSEKYDFYSLIFTDAKPNSNLDSKQKVQMAAGFLLGATKILPNSEYQTLDIVVETKDPKLSFALIKNIMKGLDYYLNEEEITKAKRNRLFVAKLLRENREAMMKLGKKIATLNQNNQTSAVSSTVNIPIDQLSPPGYTPAVLEDEFLWGDFHNKSNDEIIRSIPQQVYVEYVMLQKQIKINLETLLSQQYEMARIEEQKENNSFQIINRPECPMVPFVMKKNLVTSAAIIFGVFAGLTFVFIAEMMELSKRSFLENKR